MFFWTQSNGHFHLRNNAALVLKHWISECQSPDYCNCSYLKTPYLNSESYNKLHEAATNIDKDTQSKQRAYVKVTILLMQAVVSLKEIEKKAKKELSKETFSKLRDISPLLHQSIRIQTVLLMDIQRKRKYDVCLTLRKKFSLLLQLLVNRRSSLWWALH